MIQAPKIFESKKLDAVSLEEGTIQLYKKSIIPIYKMVHANGGTRQEAKDVLQESMLNFLDQKRKGAPIKNANAYLFSIARNQMITHKKERSRNSTISLGEREPIAQSPKSEVEMNRVMQVLETAGRRCMELLTAIYIQSMALDNVVMKFGFSNKHSASVQKYKCIQKLRNFISKKSLNYEDFLE